MNIWSPRPGRHGWVWGMLAAASVVGAITVLAVLWSLHEVALASRRDLASLRIQAIRTGLTVGAGAAGAVALVLTFRRQWHQEIVASDARHDASERRITELYSKAADQLGSEKAPVRLAGLYSLERLAQSNPEHRQTIVSVICAYLRMPYSPPDDEADDLVGRIQEHAPGRIASAVEEREVRTTAQRILADHLCRPNFEEGRDPRSGAHYWDGMRLDLTGATLISIDMLGLVVDEAEFVSSIFYGHTVFSGSVFRGAASFDNASFNGTTLFMSAEFDDMASFSGVHFYSDTIFSYSTFDNTVWFDNSIFDENADFNGVHIRKPQSVSTWPDGWTVEPHDGGGLRLVRLSNDGT